jgi:hypothetical protein
VLLSFDVIVGWISYFDHVNATFGILITPLREATQLALKSLFSPKVSLVQRLQNMKTFLKPHPCQYIGEEVYNPRIPLIVNLLEN